MYVLIAPGNISSIYPYLFKFVMNTIKKAIMIYK